MTAQEKDEREGEGDRSLDILFRKVESIDKNVEDILEAIHEHFDHESYHSMWNGREYYNGKNY